MSAFKSLLATAAVATALMAASAAQADVLVFDDFDSYSGYDGNGGLLNFTGFNELNVSAGTVDVVASANNFGIMFLSSAGADLDGSNGHAGTLRTDAYSFGSGDIVTLEFDLSGSQRDGYGTDNFFFGIESTGGAFTALNPTISNLLFFGGLNPFTGASGPTLFVGSGYVGLTYNEPSAHYSVSFTAGGTGNVTAYVGAEGGDNVGPLMDNFRFSITSVPEPATWLTMILGFGGIGAMLRRRKLALVSA